MPYSVCRIGQERSLSLSGPEHRRHLGIRPTHGPPGYSLDYAAMVFRKDYLNPGKLESKPIEDTRSWWDWLRGIPAPKPMKPADAAHHPLLRGRFISLLDNTDPPATFKASEVAQALREEELKQMGYEKWEEAVPGVIELAFELRAFGDCEIFKQGKLVPEDVLAMEIQGGCRIRRVEGPGWFGDEVDL